MYFILSFPREQGVAIIINKNVTFEPTQTIEDPNGRFVSVSGKLFDIPVILVSTYAPVWDDDKFITHPLPFLISTVITPLLVVISTLFRSLNPSIKAFSFFSHVHRTYSRLQARCWLS